MKIAIIGATGFVGSKLVKEAADRGLQVTAIARNAEKTEQKIEKDFSCHIGCPCCFQFDR